VTDLVGINKTKRAQQALFILSVNRTIHFFKRLSEVY